MFSCTPETIYVSRVCNVAACLRLDQQEIPNFLRDRKVDQCSQEPAFCFFSKPDSPMRVKSHTRLAYPHWTDHPDSTKDFQNRGNIHFEDVTSFWPWSILGTGSTVGTCRASEQSLLMFKHLCYRHNNPCILAINPLNPELNLICYLLALLAHHFLHVSRIRVKSLTLRLLMSYIYIYI